MTAITALALTGCAAPTSEDGLLRSPSPPQITVPVGQPSPTFSPTPTPTPTPTYTPPPVLFPPPNLTKVSRPAGKLYDLPGHGNLMAWTVDDGTSTEVVAAYAKFAKETGTRITFFMNGKYGSWADNAPALRPLVESGQIQIGNHTFSHPWLTDISDAAIVDELQKNAAVIKNLFGVDPAPYFRPPFGASDGRVRSVAASIGYTAPVMWYGSLSDSGNITPDQVVEFATKWFLPEHIVIGHANFPGVTKVFPKLVEIIRSRGLQTVTLDDVFLK